MAQHPAVQVAIELGTQEAGQRSAQTIFAGLVSAGVLAGCLRRHAATRFLVEETVVVPARPRRGLFQTTDSNRAPNDLDFFV